MLKKNFNIDLNKQQKAAVSHKDGPAITLAVPGAGKTTVLICRTANLILNHNISPDNILSITFSKASARDMKERFNKVFGDFIKYDVKFSTIHSFAYFVINEYARLKGINFKLIEGNNTSLNKVRILKTIFHDVNGGYVNDDKLEELLNTIGYVKNKMIDISDYSSYTVPQIKNFNIIFNKYEEYKQRNNLIDFDDMLTLTLRILKSNPYLLDKYRNKYRYIQVDEGQDTSKIQNEIVKLLCANNNNLFVVADDDQSIYGFRGASPEDLLKFEQNYPTAKTFYMEENFRSTKNIVSVCNSFIKSNKYRYDKNLFTRNENKRPVTIVKTRDEHKQYEYIIKKLKQSDDLSDSAILYRNNLSFISIAEKLDKSNISFYVRDSKLHFFKHWVVNDIVNFLKLALNNNDVQAFENIYYKMKGYLSKAALRYVKEQDNSISVFDRLTTYPDFRSFQIKNISILKRDFKKLVKKRPFEAIRFIENSLEYGKHLKEYCKKTSFSYEGTKTILSHLKTIASECNSIIGFLTRLDELQALIKNSTAKKNNTVTLSTIHSSKGLEFKNVFMIDLIDGEFPSLGSIEAYEFGQVEDLEEERRLFYVGMTRAKESLDLLAINEKNEEKVFISRFINELEYIMKENDEIPSEFSAWMKIGMIINHKRFGIGRIMDIDGDIITIKFKSIGIKQLSLNLCIEKDLLKAANS
nr:ATP-dependent helicase [Sporosalibacterium faouarense]